ncbi:MAG: twin-arginine translocation signal domain-containing protein, partial [Bacteroidales bacterium]|nr:twin-arginine translocation signal domain-containing protein [Bacteroidales bacterium]
MNKEINRREFLRKAGIASAGLVIGGMGFSSKSYARILGANDRVNLCFMGLGVRGAQQARTFTGVPNIHIAYVSDVDSDVTDKCMRRLSSMIPYKPIELLDFRKALEDKALDGVIVSAPDHWHAPAAILCAQAGKHV